jgi:hypothetical protein
MGSGVSSSNRAAHCVDNALNACRHFFAACGVVAASLAALRAGHSASYFAFASDGVTFFSGPEKRGRQSALSGANEQRGQS